MTPQEAIKELKRHREEFILDHGWNRSVVDAIDTAIKALATIEELKESKHE